MRRLVSTHAAIVAVFLFAFLAILLVLVLPQPHSRLQYLVAGTLATTGALLSIFLRLVVRAYRRYDSQESRSIVPKLTSSHP